MKLLRALTIVTCLVLSVEFIADFASNHESLLGAILLTGIAGLFIYSVKNSNKNAKQ